MILRLGMRESAKKHQNEKNKNSKKSAPIFSHLSMTDGVLDCFRGNSFKVIN